jgi:hypothetical protein
MHLPETLAHQYKEEDSHMEKGLDAEPVFLEGGFLSVAHSNSKYPVEAIQADPSSTKIAPK